MRKVFVTILVVWVSPLVALGDDFETLYEQSGYTETPRYAETIEFCERLADASPWLHYTTFGTSPQGRKLPLLVANSAGSFQPAAVDRNRSVVVLIQACIHAGESDGKDAGLMLLRDIAVRQERAQLLDNATVLFIPIFNVDGHERFGPYNRINQNGPKQMGFRVTAQRLNLNRDHLKADTPEMRAWIGLFNAWTPDILVDCHATDGADFQYAMTYIMDARPSMAPTLQRWIRDGYLPALEAGMRQSGVRMFRYVYPLEWPDVGGGLQAEISAPRFSNGYAYLRNRPALVVETHMLKDYETRVTGTYELLRHTLEYVNSEHQALRAANVAADQFAASREFRATEYALQYERAREAISVPFDGYAYTSETSDLTGGTWFKFSDRPQTFDVPFYDKVPTIRVQLPEAYIIPPEWTGVVERLELHAVRVRRLEREHSVAVDSYRFHRVSWAETPFEGRHVVTFDIENTKETRVYPAGSVLVDMNQPGARVAAHILEPQGPDSFVLWGFFDSIFEQKEYAESYVMEPMAREMLASDDVLRQRYESMKSSDADFAASARAQLNWFYQQSPYWDDRVNVYPVGKVFDSQVVDGLD